MARYDPEQQRAFAVEVVGKLHAAGFEAYWAGGCVRDSLLGRTPKDYDVATIARPEQVRELFGQRRTKPIGAAFGVITVIGPKVAGQIEVATFRQDVGSRDGRWPEEVAFSTPRADALRRDFTINGLFFDPIDERVIDFVGGRDDLERNVVRAIGDAHERFAEDKLRLLRAVRFAATLDFEIESATRAAIGEMADQISVISAERIAGELRAMLVHDRRRAAVGLLGEVGLLEAILPELSTAPSDTSAAAHGPLDVLGRLSEPSFPLALAAWLGELVDAQTAYVICRRLKLSNDESERVRWLVEHRATLLGARQMAWPRLQRILISADIGELVALDEALAVATGADSAGLELARERLAWPRDVLDPPPLVTGDDLIAHGVPRGRQFKLLLEAVRDAQLDGQIHSREEALALVNKLRGAGN